VWDFEETSRGRKARSGTSGRRVLDDRQVRATVYDQAEVDGQRFAFHPQIGGCFSPTQ